MAERLYTISAVLLGVNNAIYRVKVTQTLIWNTTAKYWYVVEDAEGNIITCARRDPPLNCRVTYNDLVNILYDVEVNELGTRQKVVLKKRIQTFFIKMRKKL
jgi:hypothetical protein